jgi:hypothetical protein
VINESICGNISSNLQLSYCCLRNIRKNELSLDIKQLEQKLNIKIITSIINS